MKVGFSLGTAPGEAGSDTALALALESARAGNETYLYLIDDGAAFAAPPHAATLAPFVAANGRLFVCAHSCQRRGLPSSGLPGAVYCGLAMLSEIVRTTDRFVAFA